MGVAENQRNKRHATYTDKLFINDSGFVYFIYNLEYGVQDQKSVLFYLCMNKSDVDSYDANGC